MIDNETKPREFEGRLSGDKDWREIVAWVGDLPPMPQVASRAISMVENPDTTAADLTDLLSTDTALAARVLKIANSAMFSRQREITTLNQAIMIIGFKALKGVVVAATLRQLNREFGRMQQLVWENSMGTALAAMIIARKLHKRYIEEIFLLGLIHGLGQIVLLVQKETARDYKKIIEIIKEEGVDFVTAEQRFFGFAHPLIGALVAKKWNFSSDTCQIILHYKDPIDEPPDNEMEEKTAIVQLADLISHNASIGSPAGYPNELEVIHEIAAFLGFEKRDIPATIQEIIEATKEQFEKEKHIYG